VSSRPETGESLYDRVGGDPAISELLREVYERVLADPELRPFFAETSMDRLRKMQREFFSAALDGPIRYSGASLAAIHFGRGIEPRHLGLFVEHLLSTLLSRGTDEQDAFDIISRINTYATEIVGEVGVDG